MSSVHVHAKSRRDINLQPHKFICDGYNSAHVSTFGGNVRRLREAAGLKGVDLAARVKVTPPVVSGWENGRTGLPETPTLLKLAKVLHCSIDDLLAGVDQEYDAIVGKGEPRPARVPLSAEQSEALAVAARLVEAWPTLVPSIRAAIRDLLGFPETARTARRRPARIEKSHPDDRSAAGAPAPASAPLDRRRRGA
jgi:transcriptional regulator with XRE-family HTH domain